MIEVALKVKGLGNALGRLTRLERNIRGVSIQDTFGDTVERLARYAVDISPVVTGAYRGSHRLAINRLSATLSVDPTARNPVSDELVIRYAGAVEDRHAVYGRTAARAKRLGPAMAKKIHRVLERGV